MAEQQQHSGPLANSPQITHSRPDFLDTGSSKRVESNDETPTGRTAVYPETPGASKMAWAPKKRRFVEDDEIALAESPLAKKSTYHMNIVQFQRMRAQQRVPSDRTQQPLSASRSVPSLSAVVGDSSSPRSSDMGHSNHNISFEAGEYTQDSSLADLPDVDNQLRYAADDNVMNLSDPVEYLPDYQWSSETPNQSEMTWLHEQLLGPVVVNSSCQPQTSDNIVEDRPDAATQSMEMDILHTSPPQAVHNAEFWQTNLPAEYDPQTYTYHSRVPTSAQPRSDNTDPDSILELPDTSHAMDSDDLFSVDSEMEGYMAALLDETTGQVVSDKTSAPSSEHDYSPGPEFEAAMSSLPDASMDCDNNATTESTEQTGQWGNASWDLPGAYPSGLRGLQAAWEDDGRSVCGPHGRPFRIREGDF